MNQSSQPRTVSRNRCLSIWLAFAAVAIGLALTVLSYRGLIPLGYKLGPYLLNHWLGWLPMGFIIIYVPIFVVLKRRTPKNYQSLMRLHRTGFILAFVLVSLHIGAQIRAVLPDIGTGMAAYASLFALVVTGIMQKNQILAKHMTTLRLIHRSMVFSFSLVIVTHIIRAFLLGLP